MSKAPSGITFEYGQPQWPDYWITIKVPQGYKLDSIRSTIKGAGLTIEEERQKGAETIFYTKEKGKYQYEVVHGLSKRYTGVKVESHWHSKPITIRTAAEKAWIKAQRQERKKRAPIVFGVPYVRKERHYGGGLISIIVFYKQVKGRFCALRAEMWENGLDSDVTPDWRLTRYGCHEVKNILKECKVQDLSFIVKHGSLASKVSRVVEEQLSIWNTIKDVMDKAPRTADGRAEELARYEKGIECPASTESTVSQ